MKHLKKSPARPMGKYILLFLLLTVIIGSWTFADGFSRWNFFGKAQHSDQTKDISQDSVYIRVGEEQGVKSITSIILQSNDGGQTWQDISQSLPEHEQPEDFFAGDSELYVRLKDGMYRSKSNLKTPVWEKENALDPRCTSIAFNRSGVMAFTNQGQIFQRTPSGTWLPIYTNFKNHLIQSIFETSDGTLFIGSDNGHYKSADWGETWKKVHDGVMGMVESDGVLLATYSKGIMRSRDNGEPGIMRSADYGEHWESVISEGGVGISVERIDGGFAAISYSYITKSRRIRISLDSGKTWNAIDGGLQPSMNISSIKQIGKYLVCGHPDGIFRSSDMGKTWNLVHPSVDNLFKVSEITQNLVPSRDNRKVFKIYVSGNVLYAVARNSGC